MKEPKWLKLSWLKAIHADQIQQHGGSSGIRDEGLIESALKRAQNRWSYENDEVDIADLAASYCHGLAKNHGFIDGNERIAFQAMYVFLGINGYIFTASEENVVQTIVDLASGELSETGIAKWIREPSSDSK